MRERKEVETGIRVRPAEPAEAATIAGFNLKMAEETEGKRLDPDRLAAGVDAVFGDPGKGRYRVALRGDRPVGCLLLTTEWSDWRNGVFWWIQSVYVPPEERRRGVFRTLYDSVLAEARDEEGVCGVRLYVERENVSARRVYDAVGMHRTSYDLYEVDFVLPG